MRQPQHVHGYDENGRCSCGALDELAQVKAELEKVRTTLILLSKVTKDKTGGSYEDWLAFKKAIDGLEERVESTDEQRYMLRQK